ncbi:hypothetical protein EDD22DRAFT_868721 [Suillus occidentalis]|nr:hypothetical protein EDD22DRAFT_868721 [Suillus occidentalis]
MAISLRLSERCVTALFLVFVHSFVWYDSYMMTSQRHWLPISPGTRPLSREQCTRSRSFQPNSYSSLVFKFSQTPRIRTAPTS